MVLNIWEWGRKRVMTISLHPFWQALEWSWTLWMIISSIYKFLKRNISLCKEELIQKWLEEISSDEVVRVGLFNNVLKQKEFKDKLCIVLNQQPSIEEDYTPWISLICSLLRYQLQLMSKSEKPSFKRKCQRITFNMRKQSSNCNTNNVRCF